MRITEDGRIGIGTSNPVSKLQINTDNITNAFSIYSTTDLKDNFKINGDGKVYARDVFVYEPTVLFPDYVFDNSYKKISLEELEIFININKHLPNVLSAEELKAQGNMSLSYANNKAF